MVKAEWICGCFVRIFLASFTIAHEGTDDGKCITKVPFVNVYQCVRPLGLLTMFTTFKPHKERNIIHSNVIKNWAALSDDVVCMTYTTSADIDRTLTEASDSGWIARPSPRTNPFGLPFVKDMFLSAIASSHSKFLCYSNGDILFTSNIISTLSVTEKLIDPKEVFIIGRRKNVFIRQRTLHRLDHVQLVADAEGKDYLDVAIDYIIFHRDTKFPFKELPDLVVGRSRYDNYLVSLAVLNGMVVIDASETITALHQTGPDGNLSGHSGQGAKWNIELLKKFNYLLGSLKAATHRTLLKHDEVKIIKIEQ